MPLGGFCFVSRTASHLRQLCFLFSSALLCWCFPCVFPPPHPDHLFLFSISFLKLGATQKDAAPFVWLCTSHQLNLLSIWLVHLLLLLSCSILSCPNASLVLPPWSSLWATLHFWCMFHSLMRCARRAELRLPCLSSWLHVKPGLCKDTGRQYDNSKVFLQVWDVPAVK